MSTSASMLYVTDDVGDRATFLRAGNAAEKHADMRAHGRASSCVRRRYRHMLTPAQCVADYRAGAPECSRDEGCSVGRLLDLKFPKEDGMGKSNYGKCVLCGRTANRDSAGRCYHQKCKASRGKVADPGPLADSLKMQEVQEQHETAGAPVEDAGGGSSGEVQESRAQSAIPNVSGQVHNAENVGESSAGGDGPGQDHFVDPSDMVTAPADDGADLPEDLDRPFILAGIEFQPMRRKRLLNENAVTVRKKSLGILDGAAREFNLGRYTHARYTVSLDGTAIALKFFDSPRTDAVTIQRSNGSMTISSVPLCRTHPELIGKKAAMEATELREWFVVRFGGEAA